jgi:hypothetical protein
MPSLSWTYDLKTVMLALRALEKKGWSPRSRLSDSKDGGEGYIGAVCDS